MPMILLVILLKALLIHRKEAKNNQSLSKKQKNLHHNQRLQCHQRNHKLKKRSKLKKLLKVMQLVKDNRVPRIQKRVPKIQKRRVRRRMRS